MNQEQINSFVDKVFALLGIEDSVKLELSQELVENLSMMQNRMTVISRGLLFRIEGNIGYFVRALPFKKEGI